MSTPEMVTDPSPSCPLCGRNDSVSAVHSLDGRYFCSCGTVFDGTDTEWRHWARRRRERIERMAGQRPPLPVQGHYAPKEPEGPADNPPRRSRRG